MYSRQAAGEQPGRRAANNNIDKSAANKAPAPGSCPGGATESGYTAAEQPVVNFMSKFRDKDTRVLNNLNSQQFIEVWNNYDKDGESLSSGASCSGRPLKSGPLRSAGKRSEQEWAGPAARERERRVSTRRLN